MTLTLSGKRVLVTGGGVGIGLATVRTLARAGANVAFTTHSRPATEVEEALRANDGLETVGLQLDATDPDAVDATVDAVAERWGGLDVLVNNAGGIIARHTIATTPTDHWESVWQLNVSTAFFTTRAALRHLGRGGRIINISSLAASNGGGNGSGAYATAKAAIEGLTRTLAKEVAPDGITVNAIAPGFILETPFHDSFTPADAQRTIVAGIPVGRAGAPTDISAAVAYLASDESAFVTGIVLDVNGGVFFS